MSIPVTGRVRQCFETLPEHRQRGRVGYPLADALMSAVAMFSLKDATLYAFDELRNDPVRQHNLRQLYGIQQAPCDTQMRSILDQVDPYALRPAFVLVHQELQKQGVLETYRFMGKYLISVDGTGLYSSSHVSCPECCCKQQRKRRGATTTNCWVQCWCIRINQRCCRCSRKRLRAGMGARKMTANTTPASACCPQYGKPFPAWK
ncbi:MAG: hypothetical protein R3E95_09405 [Thiolinea sp.]